MLVDDDVDDADIFCEAVSGISPAMECYKAENGVALFEFLDKWHPDKPDFIFLDINMPIMDGWECLQRLKDSASFNNIPTIMYSTSSAKKDVFKAYDLGVLLFITKPDDFEELSKILAIVATNSGHSMLSQLKVFNSVK